MTELDVYTKLQYDNNKVEAPAILVDEFNHFASKALNQYVNERYNLFATKQQLTDDLQFFTKTIIVYNDGKVTDRHNNVVASFDVCKTDLGLAFSLPSDYLHLLGCIVNFSDGCNTTIAARRLTADIYGGIQDDPYLKPAIARPYHYISDGYLEIRSGDTHFNRVTLDYLAEPQSFNLTQEIINEYLEGGRDKSAKLGFPDYVAYEVLRILISLILEMSSDPRLQTNPIVTKSIN